MADGTIGLLQASSPDRQLDCESLTIGGTVYRERHRLAGALAAELAVIANAAPGSSDYALAVRQVGIPAAAALADGFSNPTTITVGSHILTWNGTSWDRGLAEVPSYGACSNGSVSSGVAASTTVSLGYLFHGSGVATMYSGGRMKVSWTDGVGGNGALLKLGRITAENGAPGGTSQTIQAHNQGSAASSAIFRTGATGAPTRGTVLDNVIVNLGVPGFYEFDLVAYLAGQGYEIRPSTAEGWEVFLVTGSTALSVAANLTVSGTWREGA